jgi:hypothetical protein
VVLELWDLEDPTDGPDGHHFVLGLLACWCEDPLNLGARGGTFCGKSVLEIFASFDLDKYVRTCSIYTL